MTVDVNQAIQELLFEKEAVIVPGLGGFTAKTAPATVDYVQDIVQPPSSKLDFNPNLVINDGMLVKFLQKANMATAQEAQAAVEQYVQAVKDTLERREIHEIPKVGRLYKDYEHKVRFMPEGTNFNASAFGLPAVAFQPLSKEKGRTAPAPVPAAPMVPLTEGSPEAEPVAIPGIAEPTPASLLQKVLPWLVLVAAFLLAFTLYKLFSSPTDPVAELAPLDRVNVSPTEVPQEEQDAASAGSEEDLPSANTESAPAAETPTETVPESTTSVTKPATETAKPAPPPAPEKQTAYLVIHSFGVKSNADKFVKRLRGDGYTPQTKKEGSLFRVGVEVSFENQQEFERIRQELGKKYEAGPKTEKELAEMEGN